MLKVSIASTEFAAQSDELKTQYNLQPDGSYKLDLGPDVFTTDKDPAGLYSALEKEREERAKLKSIADKFEADAKKAELDGASTVEEMRAAFQNQFDNQRKEMEKEKRETEKQIAAQRQENANRLASNQALTVAQEVFGDNAAIMLPHVQQMLKGQVTESGESVVQILDQMTGQPVLDQNFEKFKETVSTNPLFKPMVVVSNASGGSANGDKINGLATTKDDGTPKAYGDYSSGELVRLKRESPENFQQLLASHNS